VSGKAKLAVIGGTGTLGSGLAGRWAKAGYPVVIGSRDAAKAADAARAFQGATGASNADAAKSAEIIILAVPWATHAQIIDEIKPHTAGKLVVDTTVPLVPPKVARVQLPNETSAALAAQRRLGDGVRLVSAFHNVAGHKLQQDIDIDCDVLIFGDEPKDRAIVADLAKAIGLRGVHAGPLANSVAAEALTSVLIGINRNYKVDGAGIRITGIATD
jgi:8-hydroxy-5-deazaflavin:NADPH oxidoreductase